VSATTHETTVVADQDVPVIRIVREFDAPPAKVFRAHVDPELLVRWVGPRGTETRVDRMDARTGGSYRWTHVSGEQEFVMFGSYHVVRAPDLIVLTQGIGGGGDGAVLEVTELADLGDGRTRLTSTTVTDSFETRDAIVASGMEFGVREGYERLDALVAELS
jgi:uncharacterized protein YndB with AHSA1/START domain